MMRLYFLLKNKKAIYVKQILLFIAFFCSILIFSQNSKIDYKFEILLKNKDLARKNLPIKELQSKDMKLDEIYIFDKNETVKVYSAIIYTDQTSRLKSEGIMVQSELPGFATALLTIEDIEKLANADFVKFVESPGFGVNGNDVSASQSGARLLQEGVLNNTQYKGQGVLVGIFDSGIDWKHPDFRQLNDQTKSRILRIWDQTLTKTSSESTPTGTGLTYGVEYTQAHINNELDGTPANFVRTKDISGHGTHVAGTAVGNGAAYPDRRHAGIAPEADIVIVKGGDGSFSWNNLTNSLTYFRSIATQLGKPIVVNMSIVSQDQPHDGSTPQEVAVNEFASSGPGRIAVICAGNDHKDIHKSAVLPAGQSVDFTFTVPNSTDLSSVFTFLGVSNRTTGSFGVKMYDALGEEITSTTTTKPITFSLASGAYTYETNKNRYFRVTVTRRTAGMDVGGTYTIRVTNTGSQSVTLHGWKTSGATIVFVGADNDYTIATPAGATNAITVGSYAGRVSWYSENPTAPPGGYTLTTSDAEGISYFSSKGPRLDGLQKPEITAVGEHVISALTADINPAPDPTFIIDADKKYRRNWGTSMASPAVAGAVALLLQNNPTLTYAQAKTILSNNARQDAATGTVPNTRWGYGKLDIFKALASQVSCLNPTFETILYDQQFYVYTDDTQNTYTNYTFAVRSTPTFTGKLSAVTFNTGDDATITNMPIKIQIRKVNSSGNPGDLIAEKTIASLTTGVQKNTWNHISMTDLNVPVTYGEDYYVVINAYGGKMSLRSEDISLDNRSKYSTNNGSTWANSNQDYRIRSIIYESTPEIKALTPTSLSGTTNIVNGRNYFTASCKLIARIDKETGNTISGSTDAQVWIDTTLPQYVQRRYQITPNSNAANSTAKITLYFTQADFNLYNSTHAKKLPTGPTDTSGKANLIVKKYKGVTNDNTGQPDSYSLGYEFIYPTASDIVWNQKYGYWEVSFVTNSFGGYLVRTDEVMVVARNDAYTNTPFTNTIGGQTASVLSNDTRETEVPTPATAGTSGNVTLAITGTWPTGITLNTTTGIITVAPTALPGNYTLNYTICDKTLTSICDPASVDIVVKSYILVRNDIHQVPDSNTATGNILSNDKGATLTVQSARYLTATGTEQNIVLNTATQVYANGGIAAGTFTLNANGNYTYVPKAGFVGSLPINYTAVDSYTNTAIGNLTIKSIGFVTSTNNTPIAQNDTSTTQINTLIEGNILANDSDLDENPLTVTQAQIGATNITLNTATSISGVDLYGNVVANAGSITLNTNGTFSFTPQTGFAGTVNTLGYTISDGNGATDSATLKINVGSNVEIQSFANADANSGKQDFTLSGNVLLNDSNSEDHILTVTSASINGTSVTVGTPITVANVGQFTILANGNYTFDPVANFAGTAVVSYTACDSSATTICDASRLLLTTVKDKAILVNAKALLQGALINVLDANSYTTLMRDDIRVKNMIPLQQPYTATPYSYTGTEEITDSTVLEDKGNNSIVDWVLLEIRSITDPKIILYKKAALLQRDGNIVDVDGVSAVKIDGVSPYSYHIAVRHRNHLGVMTATPINFETNATQTVDFTTINLYKSPTINEPSAFVNNGLNILWGGDVNQNGQVKYKGAGNESDAILNVILNASANILGVVTFPVPGYSNLDVNMNGEVRYSGTRNDTSTIEVNILTNAQNNTLHVVTYPGLWDNLPK